MIKLAPYQEEAVNRLVDSFRELLRTTHQNTQVVFKSPTGSGKTLMTAELLKRLSLAELPGEYVFIWASMYNLHNQSMGKLSSYLADSRYNLLSLEEISSGPLPPNTVVFTNWESVTRTARETGVWSNRAVRKGEDERNIIDILAATQQEGRQVILIVDEAHQTYLGKNSQRLVNEVIRPKLTLEVSATPILQPTGEDIADNRARVVKVLFSDVVKSELIKQETRINMGVDNFIGSHSADTAVIEAALSKQADLEKMFSEEGSSVKPLLLIQLPDEGERTSALDHTALENIENFLANKNITYDNCQLAIWLSENKRNKELIDKESSPVKVLIFKKAIATGWDCPRAQILVMLHDMKSIVFKIQTVGRILRMPEAHFYKNVDLNAAYVYTNLGSINIDNSEEDATAFFRLNTSYRKENLFNVELPSYYIHRTDYHDLTAVFRQILIDRLDARFGINEVDLSSQAYEKANKYLELNEADLKRPLLVDVTAQNLDEIDRQDIKTIDVEVDELYVERLFGYVIKSWCKPYGYVRSSNFMIRGLSQWFGKIGYVGQDHKIQKLIVCSEKNQRLIGEVVSEAKRKFEEVRSGDIRKKRQITELIFSIPRYDQFSDAYCVQAAARNAMQPYFRLKNRSVPEEKFESIIDSDDSVDWWFKNGEGRQDYFAIPYTKIDEIINQESLAGFYPDYIVRYKDGSVGIYDTKSGITITDRDTYGKSDALQQYIKQSDLKIKGGILNYREGEGFYIFDELEYDPNLARWKRLN